MTENESLERRCRPEASRMIQLMRHWDIDAPGLCVGQQDVRLSAVGEASAQRFATICLDFRPKRLICSDLRRAQQSAQPIADVLELPLELDPRWRELDMGDFTGRYWADIHAEQPEALAHWGQKWLTEGPPGGESFQDLIARVGKALAGIDANSGPTWIVTHEGALRAALVLDGAAPEAAMARKFAYGERLVVQPQGQAPRRLQG